MPFEMAQFTGRQLVLRSECPPGKLIGDVAPVERFCQDPEPGFEGAVLGTAAALVVLAVSHDPAPGVGYLLGLGVLSVAVAILASLLRALVAARRQPVTELRVP